MATALKTQSIPTDAHHHSTAIYWLSMVL